MQVAQFNYHSGSTPGRQRTVYFPNGLDNPGVDMEDGTFKRFTDRYMRTLHMLDATFLSLKSLPGGYSGPVMVRQYQRDGKLAHFDAKNKMVVVVDKPQTKPTMIWTQRGFFNCLEIVGPTGKKLIIRKHSERPESSVLETDHATFGVNCSDPNELLKAIQSVLNG